MQWTPADKERPGTRQQKAATIEKTGCRRASGHSGDFSEGWGYLRARMLLPAPAAAVSLDQARAACCQTKRKDFRQLSDTGIHAA
jgi:hypothetical protein